MKLKRWTYQCVIIYIPAGKEMSLVTLSYITRQTVHIRRFSFIKPNDNIFNISRCNMYTA